MWVILIFRTHLTQDNRIIYGYWLISEKIKMEIRDIKNSISFRFICRYNDNVIFGVNIWYKYFPRVTGKVWKIVNAPRNEEMNDYTI